jgi:hypothetical protein
MTTNQFWLVCALIATPYVFYVIQVGRRKQGLIRFKLRRAGMFLICYAGGIIFAQKSGYSMQESVIFGALLGIAAGFVFVRPPDRNRRIPSSVRRAVIARDLKGVPFDPKIHHLDHIVPFSKGGDNSVANLRVISKTENLRRGASMPKLKDLI